MPKKTCVFLQHQVDPTASMAPAYNPRQMLHLRAILKEQIQNLIKSGFTHFITGLELGPDTWCAEIVVILKRDLTHISLDCLLPYEHQADNWGYYERENYFNIISQTNNVSYFSPHETKNCRYLRDKQLLQQANIALYLGITDQLDNCQTLTYAKQHQTPLILIDPTGNITPRLQLIQADTST